MSEDKALARARGLAYRLLAARPRSRAELIAYLDGKEIPENIIRQTIQALERYGYIDDLKFAVQFARHKRETKGLSRYALKMELRKKGVSPEDSDAALKELADIDDEETVALRVARKKIASMGGLDKEKARRRLVDNLRRKGFGFEIIRRVLKEL